MHTEKNVWKLALVTSFVGCLVVVGACGRTPSPDSNPRIPAPPPAAKTGVIPKPENVAAADGKALFAANCAVCHGDAGLGDGPAAYLLWPRPRDFSKGKFKIRTTPSGQLPTDDDLLTVLTNGMPGSSMPAWRHLQADELKALVARVKELSQFKDADMDEPFNHFEKKGAGTPVAVPNEPASTPESIAKGKDIYVKQGCVKCHGETGRADGPSAPGLKDDWDQPIRPNDFTQGIFRGGSTNKDIYLRFATGMTGTPMPAYGPDLMSDEERWALVHYVKSLSGDAPKQIAEALPTGSVLEATKVDALPGDATDAAWEKIPARNVPLALLFNRTSAPRLLQVRVAHDGKAIAWQLSWLDSAGNSAPLRAEDFRDTVAMEFALKGLDTPFMMGGTDKPVEVWSWKADWQIDLEKFQDVEQIHPGMAVEMYPGEKNDATNNNKGNRPSAMPDHDQAFQSGWAAGNLLSRPDRKSPVEEASAAGFGTLTSLPLDKQSVSGKGLFKDGRWTVTMTRAFAAPDPCCVEFKTGAEIPVAFAVWDGAAGDRAGQKSVTMWFRLVLK